MGAFNLDGEAYTFAERITDLLNGTVAVGVRITPVTSGSPPRAVLGYGISARQLDNNLAIPLRVKPKARARAFLAVSFRLRLDDESQHLAVVSSFVGLFADEALERALLSYDYERDKPDDYPEAHIQVRASSDDWTELLGDDEPLAKLHLPVGGRRFRPCIEDFLEMLIREGIAEGHDGWKKRVRDGRTLVSPATTQGRDPSRSGDGDRRPVQVEGGRHTTRRVHVRTRVR